MRPPRSLSLAAPRGGADVRTGGARPSSMLDGRLAGASPGWLRVARLAAHRLGGVGGRCGSLRIALATCGSLRIALATCGAVRLAARRRGREGSVLFNPKVLLSGR